MNLEEVVKNKRTLKILNNESLFTTDDVINNFPHRFINYEITNKDGIYQDKIIIEAKVISKIVYKKHNSSLDSLSFEIIGLNNRLKVIIFNRKYLEDRIHINDLIYVYGKYDYLKRQIVADNIFFEIKESVTPVYQKSINSNYKYIVQNILNNYNKVDIIPDYLKEKYNLIDELKMYQYAHMPKSMKEVKEFYRRIKYQELFLFELMLEYKRYSSNKEYKEPKKYDIAKVKKLISSLPFELTDDQKKCVNEIFMDLKKPYASNRLIQGDVGSGKTIVCALAIYACITAGYQAALMAPTEILAKQHYHNLCKIFKNVINIGLLTASIKGKKREEILVKLKNNEIDLLVGTHALITDNVDFNNLGIVVADEQHRFGVNQRLALKNKGLNPDVLYLSATPIPRTLAISLFGDMELSLIKTKPIGRKPVFTKYLNESNIEEAFLALEKELRKNHQAYVISPLIEDEKGTNLNDIIKINDALEKRFNNKIKILHGKMKPIEKDAIMEEFKNHEFDILISTTVVEVGVDVPNATFILIYDAERFGLSQLHQLRGRVGRNSLDNYCYIVSKSNEKERLRIIEETYDGFKLAEEDLRLRGPGDFFGVKQSGIPTFKVANLVDDFIILEYAKKDAREFIENHLDDKKYIELKNHIFNIKQSIE